jgi:hypothetical protein
MSRSSDASPPSPTASFYDVSDDEEGGYSAIRHSKSDKGVKLLYAKSKVYVHPSASAKDNVAGYIAVVEQKPAAGDSGKRSTVTHPPATAEGSNNKKNSENNHNILLCWLPEGSLGEGREKYDKADMSEVNSPPHRPDLVPPPPITTTHGASIGAHPFSIPLSEIYSMLFRPPSSGWWHGSIVINSRAGESFPALFFHDNECQSTINQRKRLQRETFDISSSSGAGMHWGGDEIMKWLKNHATVERSAHEPSLYLIDPTSDDQKAFGLTRRPTTDNVRNLLEGNDKGEQSKQKKKEDPLGKAFREARWTVLEKLSQVTTFTRKTAQSVQENKNLPPPIRRLMQSPQVQSMGDEFDSARLYLARWAMSIAEQAEKERSQRIWTAQDILEMEESELGSFEVLDAEMLNLQDRRNPVTMEEWKSFFNIRTGRLEKTQLEVKERIFHGGLSKEDDVRKEAWLFLLGVYEWDSSADERKAKMHSLRDEYIRLKGAWWERLADDQGSLEEKEWWKEQRMRIGKFSSLQLPSSDGDVLSRVAATDTFTDVAVSSVEKDVHRTDRHIPLFAGEDIPHPDPDSPFAEAGTNVHLEQMKDLLLTYNEHNRDLGYVQGMSDLLAPIYAVEQDDAVAFWGFVGFMERMERNFLRDQSGMRLQLLTLDHLCQLLDPKLYEHLRRLDSTNFFFFFRMLLVWFKREFDFPDILRLWETLWTDYYSANFHLFIAMAILEKHRNVILEHLKGFDEVLKYVNELSGTIDLPSTLARAEALFRRFQRMVEAIDKKSNFPSQPAVRQRLPLPPPSPSSTKPGSSAGASASGRDATASNAAGSKGKQPEQVISPELRLLLSRDVPKLEKKEVREHGGGIGS